MKVTMRDYCGGKTKTGIAPPLAVMGKMVLPDLTVGKVSSNAFLTTK